MLIQELKTEVKMEIKIKALKFDADEKIRKLEYMMEEIAK